MNTLAKNLLLALLFGLFASTALFAQIGSIVYLEGEVSVVRDGEPVWDYIDFGFPVESFDTIKTGQDGLAELEIDEPAGLSATITVQPDTSFYLDVDARRTSSPSGVELLGGSVRVAVDRYGAGFQVRTEPAVMGVRGTVFDVIVSVQGDVLVTATEGAVLCTPAQGPEILATPGRAVEARLGERLRNLTVGGASIDGFQADWVAERLAAFDAAPIPLLNLYATRYLDLRERFADAFLVLMSRRDVLDKWVREDAEGIVGSTMERMRERRAILPGLMETRQVLFMLERVWFRLDVMLREADRSVRRSELSAGLTVGELAELFEDDAGLLVQRMDDVRYIFKLFADRNDGRLPFDSLDQLDSDDPFGSDGFDDDPFDDDSDDDDPFSDDPFSGGSPLGND